MACSCVAGVSHAIDEEYRAKQPFVAFAVGLC